MRNDKSSAGMRMLSLGIAGMLCGVLASPRNVAAQDTAGESTVLALGANGSVVLSTQGKDLCKWTPTAANTAWRFSEGIKTGRSPEGNPQFGLMASAAIQGETSLTPKAGSAEVSWTFRAKEAVSFNALAVSTSLPLEALDGGTWKADDAGGAFPSVYGGEAIFGGDVSRLEVTTVDGRAFKLRFPVPTHIGIQDNRRWGGKSFTIRVGQVFGKLTTEAPYRLAISFELPGKVEYRNDEEVVILPGQDWVPLTAFLDIVPGSALDLSGILPAKQACGAKGPVIATPDGHFAFADEPTKPQRFYGPNLCFSSQFMSKENVDILLDRWVRMGYNTLRIHHYEFGLTTPIWKSGFDWDPKKLDQLCYLIAGCAKRGIWITTDLYVSRPVAPAQIGVPAEKPYMNNNNAVDMQMYKALVPVHEPAYQDFIKFTGLLLNHVNPYTGKRLAEEPALAWISLLNEGAPGDRVKMLPQWKIAWNQWLAKRHPTRETLATAFGDLKDGEDAKAGTVEFPVDSVLSDSPRGRICQTFLASTETAFIERTRAYLRDELKCRALLTNHNCAPNTIADQGARNSFDYVDDHFYVDHPIFEGGWGLPSRSPNESPVRDGAPRATGSSQLRMWGKPFTISEFNFSGPGRYRGVGALMTGALAAIQDWDAIWRFAYAHSDKEIFTPSPIDYFNIVRDPLSLAADRAAVMLYLRGDMKTAPHRVALEISQKDLDEAVPARWTDVLSSLAWTTRVGTAIKFLPADALVFPLKTEKKSLLAKLTAAGIPVESAAGLLRSETGELTLNKDQGILTVDTPRTAGGYADPGKTINASQSGVKVDEVDTGATVFVTSLDGKPIRTAARLLVTHLTDLQNSGAHYGESARQTLLSWGGLPYLVRSGQATVHLSLAQPGAYKVWELSVAGHRIAPVPFIVENGTLRFTTTVRGAYGARMLYEVTTEAGITADPIVKNLKDMQAAADAALDITFETPFLFTYASWKDKLVATNNVAVVKASDGKGGGGYNRNLDYIGIAHKSPVLYLTIGGENKAKNIKILFMDRAQNKATFVYDLAGQPVGKPIRLTPRDDAKLMNPNDGGVIRLGDIMQIQILGDWTDDAVDLRITRLAMENLSP